MDKKNVNQYSPLTLAFLGDAVYEQLVREQLVITANMPVGKLHGLTVKKVRAEYQAAAVSRLIPHLSASEQAIIKRGRNAVSNTTPKNASLIEYKIATGLECLFGYLHLLGEHDRIREIFSIIMNEGNV